MRDTYACPKCKELLWTPDFEEDGWSDSVTCDECGHGFTVIVHVEIYTHVEDVK